MDGAAEASVHRCSCGIIGDARTMVKLSTHRDHAAAHIFTALFTHKASVDAWKINNYLIKCCICINNII